MIDLSGVEELRLNSELFKDCSKEIDKRRRQKRERGRLEDRPRGGKISESSDDAYSLCAFDFRRLVWVIRTDGDFEFEDTSNVKS